MPEWPRLLSGKRCRFLWRIGLPVGHGVFSSLSNITSVLEQVALSWMWARFACPGPGSAAGDDAYSAVVEFEIERCDGINTSRLRDDSRHGVADHDIAACEQAFMPLRMRREPTSEIVERVVAPVDKARHCGAEPRLDPAD